MKRQKKKASSKGAGGDIWLLNCDTFFFQHLSTTCAEKSEGEGLCAAAPQTPSGHLCFSMHPLPREPRRLCAVAAQLCFSMHPYRGSREGAVQLRRTTAL